MPNGYYGSREAEQAYSAMGREQPEEDHEPNAEGAEATRKGASDPFGHGGDEYGGRIPYRSKYDREREATQQQSMRQPPVQPQGMPMNSVPQQPASAPVQSQMVQPQMNTPQQPMKPPQPVMAQQGVYAQQMGNVVPFPGMQRGPDGSVYAHVEYIVLLRSRNECKDVIAYIKMNASVFLNMEFIASDNERQRCVDMLSGAAYTLGCELNKISPRGIYLISSPSVRVILDPAIKKFSAAPDAKGYARQRYTPEKQGGYGYQQQAEPVQEPQQRQQPIMGFSSGSPTTRFQAQASQRMQPVSFGSVMAGSTTGAYQAVNPMATGRYSVGPQ